MYNTKMLKGSYAALRQGIQHSNTQQNDTQQNVTPY